MPSAGRRVHYIRLSACWSRCVTVNRCLLFVVCFSKHQDRAFRSKAAVEDWLKNFGDKYASVEVVEVVGEVLVRCQQCHEVAASKKDGDKLTNGIVVIAKGDTEGSIKTNSMDYHVRAASLRSTVEPWTPRRPQEP